MEKRLFGYFSGGHLAAMVCVAMLVPGALFAAVTFSNVAVVNANTGVPAVVDTGGRLSVVDGVASYRNYPGNMVSIFVSNSGNICETSYQYVVPLGKAFIITGMSGYAYQFKTTSDYTGISLYPGAGCTGTALTSFFSTPATGLRYVPLVANYGVGIPVKAGSTISVASFNDSGYTWLHGYLVPAATVFVASSAGPSLAAAVENLPGKVPGMAP